MFALLLNNYLVLFYFSTLVRKNFTFPNPNECGKLEQLTTEFYKVIFIHVFSHGDFFSFSFFLFHSLEILFTSCVNPILVNITMFYCHFKLSVLFCLRMSAVLKFVDLFSFGRRRICICTT